MNRRGPRGTLLEILLTQTTKHYKCLKKRGESLGNKKRNKENRAD
jgi:hypothetical protein